LVALSLGNFVVLYDEAEANLADAEARAGLAQDGGGDLGRSSGSGKGGSAAFGLTRHEHRPPPPAGASDGEGTARPSLRGMLGDDADEGACYMPRSLLGK